MRMIAEPIHRPTGFTEGLKQLVACGACSGTDMILLNGLFDRSKPATLTDVAGITGITTAAVTTQMDRLVERGLAERVPMPSDRRKSIARLTSKGRQAVTNFRTAMKGAAVA